MKKIISVILFVMVVLLVGCGQQEPNINCSADSVMRDFTTLSMGKFKKTYNGKNIRMSGQIIDIAVTDDGVMCFVLAITGRKQNQEKARAIGAYFEDTNEASKAKKCHRFDFVTVQGVGNVFEGDMTQGNLLRIRRAKIIE